MRYVLMGVAGSGKTTVGTLRHEAPRGEPRADRRHPARDRRRRRVKQLLVAGGVGEVIARAAIASPLSPLLVGWLIAVGIRLATGSATVATVTTSGLVAPLAAHADPSLLALAIGAGSLFLSHVNDAGFWMVKEYFGMSIAETFATWSAMETILSVVALGLILALGAIV